jgi:hypothetical protein
MIKNIRASYILYKKSNKNFVDFKTYNDISTGYIKFLMQKIFDGKEVTLPKNLGELSIVGKKQVIKKDEEGNIKGLAPNWKETKEMWKENEVARLNKKMIYHLNTETGGYRYSFYWRKTQVLIKNKTLYSLRMTRENKRMVTKQLNKGAKYRTTL